MFLMTFADRRKIKLNEIPEWASPSELLLWEAFYALRPAGHENNFLAKILAATLHGKDWEQFRPVESQVVDNRFDHLLMDEASAADEMTRALARQLSAVFSGLKSEPKG